MHLPARSGVDQLRHTQAIRSWITEHDQDAFVVGDFNNYPRGGPAPTPEQLAALNPHLRQSRTVRLDDGTLTPDYAVDEALVLDAELVDLAAELTERDGQHDRLVPTGQGGARVDRCYGHRRWAKTATSWHQVDIGSDHDAIGITFDLREVAA